MSVAPFEYLLTALHPDRERAGAHYRDLHRQLSSFFHSRSGGGADEHADEVLDRLCRRIAEGERIDNLQTYALGVARLRLRELRKHAEREQALHAELLALWSDIEQDDVDEQQLRFERCLDALSAQDREIILAYYTGEGRTKIETRRKLADDLGVDLNALRVRAHRIRTRLERCISTCNVFDCVATPK